MIIKKHNQNKNIREDNRKLEEVVEETPSVSAVEISEEVETFDEVVQESIPEHFDDTPKEPEIDLFDVENIDFAQRQERRRGTRRRGYRRIDDRNLVSRAREEAENIKKAAFEEGYQQGLELANVDLAEFREQFQNFMNSPKEVFEFIAPDILEISIDIAQKVIKQELKSDPQVLMNTIVEVLKTVSKNEPKVNIRINPQLVPFIKDSIPEIIAQNGLDAKINIIADAGIQDGGCIFQTNNGVVDASLETQLEIIKKSLLVGS